MPRTLDRYLRALASDGVFAEDGPGVYRNTEASELLRRGTPWNAFAQLYGGVWHRAAGALDADRREGVRGRSSGPGSPTTRASARSSTVAMEDGTEQRVDRIAGLVWRDGETVVDVGGGNGSLLLDALRTPAGHARNRLRPARRPFATRRRSRPRESSSSRAASSSASPTATSTSSRPILHDWADEERRRDPADDPPRRPQRRARADPRLRSSTAGTSRTARSGSTCSMLALFGARERTRRSGARCSRPQASSSTQSRSG